MRPSRIAPPPAKCPRCRSTAAFSPVELQEDNAGCLLFLLGGFIPYLLHRSTRRELLQCASCRFVFRPAQPFGKWEFAVAVLLVAVIVALVVYILFAELR